MWTSWRTAQSLERLEINQIDFTDYNGQLDVALNIVSVAPARATSVSTGALTRQETNSLLFRNFGFEGVGVVIGLEVRVLAPRLARIQDRTIQLYSGGAVGRNLANPLSEDDQIYGGSLETWGLEAELEWNTDSWGVVVDLQPHVAYPSSNPVFIQRVDLRLNVV